MFALLFADLVGSFDVSEQPIDRSAIPDIIRASTQLRGFPPTVREISLVLGCVVSTAHYHLAILRAEGVVDWEPGTQRTLHVIH